MDKWTQDIGGGKENLVIFGVLHILAYKGFSGEADSRSKIKLTNNILAYREVRW